MQLHIFHMVYPLIIFIKEMLLNDNATVKSDSYGILPKIESIVYQCLNILKRLSLAHIENAM